MDNNEKLVVVLSRNYSTGLSVIRSLGTKGYTVDLVASAPREGASAFIAKSKFVRNAYEAVSKKVKQEEDTELVDILLAYEGQWPTKPVLVAADDYTASVMDKNSDKLKNIFLMPGILGGEPGSLTHMMDKSVQGKIARSVGIKTPKEWVVSLREEEFDIPEDMIYPCYVKPLGSTFGYKQEMARCNDIDELKAHLQKLRESYSDRSILVQEFMFIDEEYDLEGVCMDQDIVIPGIVFKEFVAQYDRGVPLYGEFFAVEKFGAFMEKVYEFLREFHYFGMFDLGFNVIDGEYYFNELNLRSGGTNYVYFESGANLSEIFVKAALGENLDPEECKAKVFGKKYLYEKVAWDDYFHKYLTKDQLNNCTETADIHIMVNDYDPIPGEIFMEEVTAEEKRLRRKELRNQAINKTMEDTGWDREQAKEKLRETREHMDVSYKDYAAFKLWRFPLEEQEEAYQKALKKRERLKKQREEAITYAMDIMGWSEEEAKAQIKDARERLGISYKDYTKYRFCLVPLENQAEEYDKILIAKEKEKEQKEQKEQ
ncbi:MAG: hypothetical protein II918_04935 [Firmicutes bacterium]|nr:hypothetical protein [Bacillota bacterium]